MKISFISKNYWDYMYKCFIKLLAGGVALWILAGLFIYFPEPLVARAMKAVYLWYGNYAMYLIYVWL